MLDDSNYVTFWERQDCGDDNKIEVARGGDEEAGRTQAEHGACSGH